MFVSYRNAFAVLRLSVEVRVRVRVRAWRDGLGARLGACVRARVRERMRRCVLYVCSVLFLHKRTQIVWMIVSLRLRRV